MFRRTWKQLRILIVLIILLICLPHSILPHQNSGSGKDDLDIYLKMNDKEQRLIEFKDDESLLKLKLTQLDLINESRKKHNAPPVKLDILASRVANKMSREAAENNFVGHWNMAGEKPYMRYAFAGGHDHVSENAFGEWSSADYNSSESSLGSLMKSGHRSFMSERAPNDGHKQNIIDKSHNFVGIGCYISGKQFRYYEEFINRYFEFENIPSEVAVNESFNISLKTGGQGYIYFLIIYREKLPKPLTPAQINSRGSYEDFTDEEYLTIPAWDLSRYRNGTLYQIPLKFSKDGLYYIQIYTDKKQITKPGSISTKGKTPYSGIVIRVD